MVLPTRLMRLFSATFLAIALGGCMEGPATGTRISGCPDGTVERLTLSSTGVVETVESTFLAEVNREDQVLVVVDFWAEWCGPCKALAPHLREIKRSWGDKVEIVKVDVDSNEAISRHLGINSIPDVRIFRNGVQVGGFVGLVPREEIDATLKSLQ
jgi:thioredoxin 1